jgi:acetoacetyl-CoA synthetase
MKVEIYSPDGMSIEDTGEAGELVCTRPHPSLPVCFWGDEKGEKLRSAYYEMFPGLLVFCTMMFNVLNITVGVWRQGDFIVKNPKTKGFIILGRR